MNAGRPEVALRDPEKIRVGAFTEQSQELRHLLQGRAIEEPAAHASEWTVFGKASEPIEREGCHMCGCCRRARRDPVVARDTVTGFRVITPWVSGSVKAIFEGLSGNRPVVGARRGGLT